VLDQLGVNGIADEVNYHVWTMIAAIGATAFVQSAPTVISNETQKSGTSQTFAGNFIGQGTYASENTFNRYLDLMPTITVHDGMPFRIFFSEEQFAPPIRQRDNFRLTNVHMHQPPGQPGDDGR
jgi:type IV secretory pathway VirB10-like protein